MVAMFESAGLVSTISRKIESLRIGSQDRNHRMNRKGCLNPAEDFDRTWYEKSKSTIHAPFDSIKSWCLYSLHSINTEIEDLG
mmetsp:Transcript_4691/g.9469  ORF Transcript_4691/g.9469 Transcript_4691/m.9469 type:complete len:83 (-) Transcript_4691:1296-1544(-)